MNVQHLSVLALPIGIVAAVIANKIARSKGRRSGPWGFFTFWFPPLLPILCLLPSKTHDLPRTKEGASDENDTPSRHITIEKYERNVFGKIIAAVFWGWQLLMIVCLVVYLSNPLALALWGDSALLELCFVWLCGAIILGLMMYFTRGTKITITN
jgi:hypothetical protein